MRFNRLPEHCGPDRKPFPNLELRDFPQVLRSSAEFVRGLGHKDLNEIVDIALTKLTQQWKYISIDTRLSMLMVGMFPSIPGWHVDDFWRPGDGKYTDLLTVPEAEHICMNLGSCSNTVFVNRPVSISIPTVEELAGMGVNVHSILHNEIEGPYKNIDTITLQDGEMWRFYPTSIHRGSAATQNAWRYFFRLTGSNHRAPKNEVRTQSQVYVTDVAKGW